MGTLKVDGNLLLTGDIRMQTSNVLSSVIQVKADSNGYGQNLLIGAGGNTVIGGGESASTFFTASGIKDEENLYLTADGSIHVYTNCDTIANRKLIMSMGADGNITTTGTIITPGNDSVVIKPAKNNYDQIGASDCKFWKIHATTFYGNLSGNADTATTASAVAWGNVTGKPSSFTPSSHTHSYIEAKGTYTFTSSTLPNSFDLGISAGFVDSNSGFGNYGSVLTVRTYSGGGGSLQLYAPYSPTYGGTRLKARFGNYDSSSGNSWTSLKEIAWLSDLTWSNISGKPSTFTPSSHSHNTLDNISAIDEASSSSTQRYIFMAYNDLITNRPAYDTRLTFQTSTGTLSAPIFKGSLSGTASYATQADSVYGRYTGNGGNQIPSYIGANTTKFNMMRNFGSSDIGGYMDCILMNNYSWSDVPYATGLGITKTNGYPRAIIANGPKTGWAYATELLTSYNYSWWALPLSGGTMTGKLQVNNIIFGYNYTNSNNAAAFMFDKPGSYYTGIGANGSDSTIKFGPCNADGTWVNGFAQHWTFQGTIRPGCIILTNDQWTGYGTADPNDLGLDKVVGRLYFRI